MSENSRLAVTNSDNRYLGIALGSGAARGISHLGVIRNLIQHQIEPRIVAGTSIGALIGACYAAGEFDQIEAWFKQLTLKKLLVFLDPKLTSRGGLADGAQFVRYMKETFGDIQFEQLNKKLVVVATDMNSGREVWIESGSVWEAVRASMAYPGILSPVHLDGQFLLDGGLVNPVPVIACRAKGARRVIAVNLNSEMITNHQLEGEVSSESGELIEQSLLSKISGKVINTVSPLLRRNGKNGNSKNENSKNENNKNGNGKSVVPFNTIDVLAASINIMQDRITRSRLAGEPPDVMLMPRLGHIGMFEIDRFEEIYSEGMRVVDKVHWEHELE
ncbi:patatin-like phospholipase family protein [Aliikangiella sp. G2MR2-5]|uniref:patatin-like phospholipase family protein n=1 Tax=Aliikangiella sp. G2MR2-5 TaxID=2788943 RepID=UPI0018AC585F|nr:patatin-like phospholipase family protein [Aliikangiella sp. G2MR2-5]